MNIEDPALGKSVRQGLVWSLAGTLVLRLGSLTLGIVLAHLLSPEAFGVYAVALTVQAILMTLADLGLSADLIRSRNPNRNAPTVATLSLGSGIVLTSLMFSLAGPLANSLGSPSATPVIRVLSLTLVVGGLGVVPYAKLQRDFQQQRLFATSAADFVVSTGLTVALVLAGLGPMALAISRLVAQSVATFMQFVLSHTKPRFGFDRTIAGPSLRFGLPLAGANLLSWVLLNIDNIVIAKAAGEIALGFYVLAFNVSSWPMSAIGTGIRSVSLTAFSRTSAAREDRGASDRDRTLAIGSAYAWAAAIPAGAMLAVLAVPIIQLLYGDEWQPSASVLAALGLFGALRVLFDLMATYLMAHGAARPVLAIQVLWIVALTPAMIVMTRTFGISGGGWAHVAVGFGVILPAYLVAVHRVGANLGALAMVLWPPVAAGIPAWLVSYVVISQFDSPVAKVAFGGLSGSVVYLALVYRWVRRVGTQLRAIQQHQNTPLNRPAATPSSASSLEKTP